LLQKIIVLALLILINGFFAATEMAMVSLNTTKLKILEEGGNDKAKKLRKLSQEPSKFLATTQIGISLIGLLSGAVAASSFSGPLVSLLQQWGVPIAAAVLEPVCMVLITCVLSYFTLVFGELVPKQMALDNPNRFAMAIYTPIRLLAVVANPFVKLLSFSSDIMLRLLGKQNRADSEITEEEIRMLAEVSAESGHINEDEIEMIHNVFDFNDKTAEDIATHRTDIVALPVDAAAEDILDALITSKYSRIPVFEDNIDNIVGILHVKDIIRHVARKEAPKPLELRSVIRKAFFIPLSKKTDELFEEMQKQKVHLAVVVDEYGGTIGIVTMEDLIEEIMGNIFDEYDEEEAPDIQALDDNTFSVNGTTELEEVSDFFDVPLPVEEYDTLSGFLVGQLGRIPDATENPEIEFNGLLFKVTKVEEKRISSVVVAKTGER